jgi:hypothetical protein
MPSALCLWPMACGLWAASTGRLPSPDGGRRLVLKDLTLVVPDRPGTLAHLADAIGKAGINIEAFSGHSYEGVGVLHLLVEDARIVRKIMENVGLEIRAERDVLVVDTEDRPGALAAVAHRIAGTGVNIDFLYGVRGRLIFGVEDFERAEKVL